MIKTLMEIPYIVVEDTESGGWNLSVDGLRGCFQPTGRCAGMLFIELDALVPSLSLLEQWNIQFSSGEFANNFALVHRHSYWWLAQYFENTETLSIGVQLQIELVECMLSIMRSDVSLANQFRGIS